MKNILLYSLLSIMVIGCASNTGTDYTTSTAPASPEVPADVPNWFMETPAEDEEYYYATAVADMGSMQNAINRAAQDGQRQLSELIQVNVESMVKSFTEEAGITSNGESNFDVIEFYSSVSKSVSNNTMSGAKILKKYPYKKPSGGYKAYVLMGLKKSAVRDDMVKQMQANSEEAMYAKFKASQAFQELEAEASK